MVSVVSMWPKKDHLVLGHFVDQDFENVVSMFHLLAH
jgi:hypothetical protein